MALWQPAPARLQTARIAVIQDRYAYRPEKEGPGGDYRSPLSVAPQFFIFLIMRAFLIAGRHVMGLFIPFGLFG
jgi:hypothetical protein